jgi:hypothetical protein
MAEQLQPESITNVLADFDRRLRNLEATRRLGLSAIRSASQNGIATSDPTYGAWESVGDGLQQHTVDTGAVAAGYPALTLTVPARVLIIVTATVSDVGVGAGFKSAQGTLGLRVNGVIDTGRPFAGGMVRAGGSSAGAGTVASIVDRRFTPGSYTFEVAMLWELTNAGGSAYPYIENANLIIIPTAAA